MCLSTEKLRGGLPLFFGAMAVFLSTEKWRDGLPLFFGGMDVFLNTQNLRGLFVCILEYECTILTAMSTDALFEYKTIVNNLALSHYYCF